MYVKIPFMSRKSNQTLETELSNLINRFFPQIKLNIIFVNQSSIGKYFQFKDKIDTQLRSNIVYKYSCLQCSATYVGETTRHLRTRICEHRGVSNRSGNFLINSPNSNIFKHYLETGHEVSPDQFKIISDDLDNLKITESIVIHTEKPSLNVNVTSIELKVL